MARFSVLIGRNNCNRAIKRTGTDGKTPHERHSSGPVGGRGLRAAQFRWSTEQRNCQGFEGGSAANPPTLTERLGGGRSAYTRRQGGRLRDTAFDTRQQKSRRKLIDLAAHGSIGESTSLPVTKQESSDARKQRPLGVARSLSANVARPSSSIRIPPVPLAFFRDAMPSGHKLNTNALVSNLGLANFRKADFNAILFEDLIDPDRKTGVPRDPVG